MNKFRLPLSAFTFLLVAACAPSFVQDKVYFNDLSHAPGGMIGEQKNPAADQALAEIKKAETDNAYGEKDQLLLGMDLGMASHVSAHYRASEEVFRKSDRLAEELFTKSFTDILMAYQLNDYSLPYKGMPYERVMINLVNSLNYAATGDWSGALVEARKIRTKLVEYNRMYPKAAGTPGKYASAEGGARNLLAKHNLSFNPSQLNHYTDDAFARYLSGIYEEAQVASGASSYQSAYLSYKKAYATYQKYGQLYHTPIPTFLVPALLRTSEAAERTNEFRKWRQQFPKTPYTPSSDYEKMGHILFVGFNGKIFHLGQEKFAFPFPVPGTGTLSLVSFSYPKVVGGGTDVISHEIAVTGPGGAAVANVTSETGDDLMAIGTTNFKDHLSRLLLREAIRATLKTIEQVAAQKVANQAGGGLAELGAMVGGMIFTAVSDQADIRSWRLLPATIDAAMVDLPPGSYDLMIHTRTGVGLGGVLKEKITVTAGQYLLVRTVNPPQSTERKEQ
ncbi:MAG: COG3014 family protein [Leptospirales bacterium]